MYNRIGYIANSGNEEWAGKVNYVTPATKGGSHPKKDFALPFMVSNEISQEAYKELGKDTTNLPPNGNYEIVSEHNIGYFTGSANSSKINGKSFNNTIGNNDLTTSNGEITGFKIYTKKSEISGDKQEVTNLDSNIKTKMVDILNDSSKIIKGFRLNKQVSNNNPIKGFKINGKASCLPSSAIWFVPKEDGIAKIIVDACNESGSVPYP